MEKEEFYKKFKGLESQRKSSERVLKKLLKRSKNLEQHLENAEEKIKNLDHIEEILTGLERKKYYRDYPGKYETAYYFVKSISDKDVEKAIPNKPTLYKPCPSCKNEMPVIMSYEQTYDSPRGDTWQTKAFIVCMDKSHKPKITNLAEIFRHS